MDKFTFTGYSLFLVGLCAVVVPTNSEAESKMFKDRRQFEFVGKDFMSIREAEFYCWNEFRLAPYEIGTAR